MADTWGGATTRLVRLPIKSTDDPEFERIARRIDPPPRDPTRASQFFGAYAAFETGQASGGSVDISYYYASGGHEPHKAGFDRHQYSEELWIAVEGDFYMPAGLCARPGDMNEVPDPEQMYAFLVHQGDVFALRPHVWHAGVWPVVSGANVRFMMLLSGHRPVAGGKALDNPIRFAPDTEIIPDLQ